MKKITLLFVLIVGFSANAQRTCGMEKRMTEIMSDPIKKQKYMERQNRFEQELHKLQNVQYRNNETTESTNNTIRIPVAVHFPSVSNSSNVTLKNCLRNLAQSQINRLNADYNATNTDISNWTAASSFYPMVSNVGSMDVEFVLATQNHPTGTGLSNGTVAVTFGTDYLNGLDYDTTWAGYINIAVRYADGYLGYSLMPGDPNWGDAVIIDSESFGAGAGCTGYVPSAPFNLGRTLTHELGHFFNLDHTFAGCGETNCSQYNVQNPNGDGVCDTPAVSSQSFNCPTAGSKNGCIAGQKALTMNYMDYVNDACMYMFTPGQIQRMTAQYNAFVSENTLKTNVLSTNNIVKNNFSIYPNPNNGTFTIQFKDLSNDYSIEVFDISGRIVFEDYYTQNSNLEQTISIDKPSSGVYFVNIKSGSTITTEKIIIK
jgi:hypothetical protein